MPARESETGKLARQYGIPYALAKYRLAHGIPLDAPRYPNGNAKAWKTRKAKMPEPDRRAMEKRKAELVKRRARQDAERAENELARQKRDAGIVEIVAAPKRNWSNPFAAMVCGHGR